MVTGSAWRKNNRRELRHSLGRFLAIVAIVALGVGFFAGLKVAQPAMLRTGSQYVQKTELFDYRLVSTLGLTQEDADYFAGLDGVRAAEGARSVDLTAEFDGEGMTLKALTLSDAVNRPSLTAGRMPERADECLADADRFTEADLGKTLTVQAASVDDAFTQTAFTIVGLAETPLYLGAERGTTSLGGGTLNGFVLLQPEAFAMDYFTEIYLLLDGTLSLLMFVMFLIVGSRVFDPLTSALTNFAEFRYFSIAGGRILSLMEEPEMTGNRKAPKNGDITLEGVSFAYRDKEVLHDVSLTLPQGSLTALVGPSGSGKSTLMKLCARFYDPQRGHVLFNGVRMDEIEPESLMRHISMVFQDVYLFQDTIRNNIRFGKADATDEQIVAAAKKACSHDFIMRLPKGYDTMVGEGGCTLSGGEKQRLSIARAILKDAQTILLDEATASLDPENEVEVQRAINTLIAGRTVIVIAHRLKTIRNADNIVVLDQGRIAEQGTHDQLVAHGGLYARLWAIQERTAGWSITS
mgnify:CR=1 FL=1